MGCDVNLMQLTTVSFVDAIPNSNVQFALMLLNLIKWFLRVIMYFIPHV